MRVSVGLRVCRSQAIARPSAVHRCRGEHHYQDPVCGNDSEPCKAAGTEVYNGVSYVFCSPHCLEKFRADPAQYMTPAHDSHRGAPTAGPMYTCPMHPEVVRLNRAAAPSVVWPSNHDRESGGRSQSRTGRHDPPVLDQSAPDGATLAAGDVRDAPGQPVQHAFSARLLIWVQLIFATPVVLWGGWPFFTRGWASLVNRSLNMFTLIAIGTGTAYVYSVIATLVPDLFPASFRTHGGAVAVYFEAAAVITALVLLGQVLELRARSQTSSAIKALLAWRRRPHGASAKTAAKRMCPWSRSSPATACGSARARRSRSMEWCWRERVPWTNR